jgi:hypothetical protein
MIAMCSDVLCGQIFCNPAKELVNFALLELASVSASTAGYLCNSTLIDAGVQQQSPDMVPNGAQCGVNKVTATAVHTNILG